MLLKITTNTPFKEKLTNHYSRNKDRAKGGSSCRLSLPMGGRWSLIYKWSSRTTMTMRTQGKERNKDQNWSHLSYENYTELRHDEK